MYLAGAQRVGNESTPRLDCVACRAQRRDGILCRSGEQRRWTRPLPAA